MDENEKQKLLQEYNYLTKTLELHAKLKDKLWDSEQAYQNHINDILDEMVKIKKRLAED